MALFFGAMALATHGRSEAPAPATAVRKLASALPVSAAPADRYVGVVVAKDAIDVAPKVAGRLLRVPVQVGDRVKAGDLLAELDDRELRRDLALANASLAGSEAAEVRAGVELGDAKERSDRRLKATLGVSEEELSSAQYKQKMSDAALLGAKAQVAERRAQVAKLTEQLRELTIRAPFDGTLAARYAAPGSLVGASTPLARLIRSGDPIVRFAVPLEVSGRLKVGGTIRVDLEGDPASLDGVIEHIAPEVDAASQLVLVEATAKIPPALAPRVSSGLVCRVALVGDLRAPSETR